MAAIHGPLPQARRGVPIPYAGLRANRWIIAALLVFGLGAALPVIQNATATTRGFDVQRIESRQAGVRGEIAILESEVAALTSLDRIEQRARDIGLVPGDGAEYVSVAEAGPEPAKIPSEYLPGPVSNRAEPESWLRSLFSWVTLGQ